GACGTTGYKLNRPGYRGEIEVMRAHGGNADVVVPHGLAGEQVRVLQHVHRRIVEAEIVHGSAHRAVLDQECAVARQAGNHGGLRIEPAHVPETGDEHSPLHALHEIGRARATRAASELVHLRLAGWRF